MVNKNGKANGIMVQGFIQSNLKIFSITITIPIKVYTA